MKKIDTSKWKEFRLGDLFVQERGKEKAPKRNHSGNCPLIQETNNNNGLDRFVIPTKVFKGNAITISINYASNVFYQENDFCASVNVAIIRNRFLNKYVGLFISSLLSNIHQKYDYQNKISKDIIDDEVLLLPVTDAGNPNWQYMEDYMRDLKQRVSSAIEEFIIAENFNQKQINVDEWKEFKISDLFNIETGKDLILFKAEDGVIPVISHSAENNGIQKRVAYIDGCSLYNATDTLSLADRGNFKCFVQDEDFYIGTRVKALISKTKISKGCMLYLSVLINTLANKFSYKDNATSSLGEHCIKLPVSNDGNPNWQYMEDYMRVIQERVALSLDNLVGV